MRGRGSQPRGPRSPHAPNRGTETTPRRGARFPRRSRPRSGSRIPPARRRPRSANSPDRMPNTRTPPSDTHETADPVRSADSEQAATRRRPKARCHARRRSFHDGAGAPDIDPGEEEQPYHVDEMPIPGGGLETEMTCRREMSRNGPAQTHDQEDRADDHVHAMETRGHEERRAVDRVEVPH